MPERWNATWGVLDGWERASLLALLTATVGQTAFVAVYLTRTWWRYRVGRALMFKSVSLCAILWVSVISTFYLFPYHEQVSALVIWAIAAAVWYQTIVLITSPTHLDTTGEPDEHDRALT